MAPRPKNSHIELLTIAEAAKMLRVSDRTVRRMIDAEELLSCRVRTKLFVIADDVRKYLQRH